MTDVEGQVSTTTATAYADPGVPVASFTFSCQGLTCTFDGSPSTDAYAIAAYSWDFGDGTSPGSGATSSHTFASSNAWSVTLTVWNYENSSASTTRQVTVNGAPAAAGESFFPLAPCRVLDTRQTTVLTNGTARIVPVAGHCGVPAGADAVAVNLTAVSPTNIGSLSLYPGTSPASGGTVSVSFASGQTAVANNALLALGTDGSLGVLPTVAGSPGHVQLLIDVADYFSAGNPLNATPLGFQTVTPCRLADTRNPSNPLAANTVRKFQVQQECGIPSGAAAAALNLTVVPGSNDTGYLSVFPSNATNTPPGVSTLNFYTAAPLANGAITGLAAPVPDVSVLNGASGTSNVLLDVNGYFQSGAPLLFHPVVACRAVDTRSVSQGAPSLAAATSRTFQIQGNCGVPQAAGVKAVALDITVVNAPAAGFLTAYPSNSGMPGVSTLNFAAGSTLGNGAIVPVQPNSTSDLTLIANTGPLDVIVDVFGYFE